MQEPSPGYLGRHSTVYAYLSCRRARRGTVAQGKVPSHHDTEYGAVPSRGSEGKVTEQYMPQDAWEGGRVRDRE